jgi:phosphoglycolate phosphatase
MAVKAVLFDLDGTLLDTLNDIADSANYVLERFGDPSHSTDAYRYFVGNGVDVLVSGIVPESARNPENLKRVKKAYLDRYGGHSLDLTRPYDGIEAMLAELKSMRLKLAVISNKPDADTKFTVSRLFASDVFDAISGGGSGIPLKPDPTMALGILGGFGLPPGCAVMVGDTAVDLATAKNAGCGAVGVTWGFRPEEAAVADFVISRPSELPPLIRGMM